MTDETRMADMSIADLEADADAWGAVINNRDTGHNVRVYARDRRIEAESWLARRRLEAASRKVAYGCWKCAAEIPRTITICPHCGAESTQDPNLPKPDSEGWIACESRKLMPGEIVGGRLDVRTISGHETYDLSVKSVYWPNVLAYRPARPATKGD